jgi:cytoskeletal protein CcmA (bactofilin family)
MESDKNNQPAGGSEPPKEQPNAGGNAGQDAPADALSRTPEDLDQEASQKASADQLGAEDPTKKLSPFKRVFRKVNLYLLIFILVVAVAAVIAVVSYLNSVKTPVQPTVNNQALTQDALKQLANTDASVGDTSQTLTIQGNAVIAGQTLARGNVNIAGNLQTGGSIQGPTITISGQANLGETQVNSLQVATNTAIQGTTTLRDLTVSGTTSFSGPVTASQLTVTNLILSGNASLQVPNHIGFTGSTPTIAPDNGVLGGGGSASISGSDVSGTINVNTGNNPTVGCFAHMTFKVAYTNPPHVIVGPIGSGAGQVDFYVNRDKSGFSVCANTTPPHNQVFGYDYFITN